MRINLYLPINDLYHCGCRRDEPPALAIRSVIDYYHKDIGDKQLEVTSRLYGTAAQRKSCTDDF